MQYPRKVLVGFLINGNAGGIDKFLLNLLEYTDRDKVRFDFLTNRIDPILSDRLEKYGSRLFEVSNLKHPVRQYRQICDILCKEKYDTTYFNVSTAYNIVGPYAAKKCGIEMRILHSHSTSVDCRNKFKRTILLIAHHLCKGILYHLANRFFACSHLAGMWLYPKKIIGSSGFRLVNNAVNVEKFCYNPETRLQVRQNLKIGNRYVIGHVGNFCYQKNHQLLLKIFAYILKTDPACLLMLVGDGPDFEAIKRLANELRIADNVLFMGRRTDVPELLQAMDVFVLPSRFEGLSVVGIEAQAAGLPCVFSKNITTDNAITQQVSFLGLKATAELWADTILEYRQYMRRDSIMEITKGGYNLLEQGSSYYLLFQ